MQFHKSTDGEAETDELAGEVADKEVLDAAVVGARAIG